MIPFWQGLLPIKSIGRLVDAIYCIRAKNSRSGSHVTRRQGLLEPTPGTDLMYRSWIFAWSGKATAKRLGLCSPTEGG